MEFTQIKNQLIYASSDEQDLAAVDSGAEEDPEFI